MSNGNQVFAIEPNEEMRKIAEARLSNHSGFVSIDGSAESTKLGNGSVDFVTATQSFHWFRPSQAKVEFARILRKNGWVVLTQISNPLAPGLVARSICPLTISVRRDP